MVSTVLVVVGAGISVELVSNGNSGIAIAQTEDNSTEKSIVFNSAIIRFGTNETSSRVETLRHEINGTNDELIQQFPEVLKKFENISHEVSEEVNATAGNVSFIERADPNQPAMVIPYENVTDQTYLDEFKSLLERMDLSDSVTAGLCWETIVVPPEEIGTWQVSWAHVTRCWGSTQT